MQVKQKSTWFTPRQAANYLGVKVDTIYKYIRLVKDPLPCIYLSSRTIRINRERLEEWISTYNLKEDE